MHIGQKIKKLRKIKNLTQTDLAKLIGCAQNTVADWENEKNKGPGNKFIGDLARVFEVTVDDLLYTEKKNQLGIPCYGEIQTNNFKLNKHNQYFIKVPKSEYQEKRYALKICGKFMEPLATNFDYCIFEKKFVEDNDIVLITNLNSGASSIKVWHQHKNIATLSDLSLESNQPSIFFDICKGRYIAKDSENEFIIEGILVVVKKTLKVVNAYPKIKYVLG